jgi:hypothetical protein
VIWENDKAAIAATKFHVHLDECQQCEAHPFDLCSIGRELLREFARIQGRELPGFVAPVGAPPSGRGVVQVDEGEAVVGFVAPLPPEPRR